MPTLWTIGYERRTPEALAAELTAAGVQRVLDVRFRPQSRQPGMSKTRLGALLAEHGIAYVSRRDLGTPPDVRPFFRRGAVAEGAKALLAHIDPATLDALASELVGAAPPTALLCLEADPAHCHRTVIARALQRRRPELHVVEL
jgi:uncharacterized protein (DUF488 family)